ncbi:MAG: thiamine phosphate synthase [Gemmatimonadota bacterium]
MTASREPKRLPRLHLVTDDDVLREPGQPATAEALLEAGGDRVALHIRGPGLEGREIWERAAHCMEIARRTGGWLFVNDRIDVALACGAPGVQLGRASIPIASARALLGDRVAIGASVHSRREATEAAAEGADFVFVGTLYETPTHPGRRGSGTSLLGEVADIGIPMIGIGGVSPDRVREVLAAGAHGVAVIRGVWGATDPVDALREYLEKLE